MEKLQEIAVDLPFLWWTGLTLTGLCVGSFLNVVIYRLPVMIANEEKRALLPADELNESFDLFLPASHCPRCGVRILWQQNIPLLSWLWLRGQSRCCNTPVSMGYPLIELAAMGITLLSGYLLAPGWHFLGVLIFGWIVLALAVIDGKAYLLPDALTYPLLWLGLLFNLKDEGVPLQDAVTGAVAGYSVLWLFNYFTSRMVKKCCMGNGDFKLTAAIAAWSGWQCLPQLLLFAAMTGIIILTGARLLYKRELTMAIPFGPGLAIAGWLQIVGIV